MTAETAKPPLDDLMLAMDVVDTLRHTDAIVKRELNSEDQDRALLRRLKEIYAGQGIEVPDAILAEGVAALREDRFTYSPPPPSLSRALARAYVNRGGWIKGLGLVVLIAVVIGAGYFFTVVMPEQRAVESARQESIAAINALPDRFAAAFATATNLGARLTALTPVGAATPYLTRKKAELATALQSVNRILTSEAAKPTPPTLSSTANAGQVSAAKAVLGDRLGALASLEGELAGISSEIDNLSTLLDLSRRLQQLESTMLPLAEGEQARFRTRELIGRASDQLALGELGGSRSSIAALGQLSSQIGSSYTIRVVSRPGEQSGVWRVPPNNPNAQNYYLIVEGVDGTGKTVSVPIANEESGATETVSSWGLRVPQAEFERVRRDKQDDGIIQDDLVGSKRRGYLTHSYSIQTDGATITRW